jgi:hypothetical protein
MRKPDDSHRHLIVGRTGSGKTQAAMDAMSYRSFDTKRWIIFDYKGDALIAQSGAREIGLFDPLPELPGLYVVRPLPTDDVKPLLWQIWREGNTGIYVDEGYMIDDGDKKDNPFRAILTQGRSKQIPVILLSQRPVWLSRFAFSEATFIQLFDLTDLRDAQTVTKFVPMLDENYAEKLGRYQSYYYDVERKKLAKLAPARKADKILAQIRDRMPVMEPERPSRRLKKLF